MTALTEDLERSRTEMAGLNTRLGDYNKSVASEVQKLGLRPKTAEHKEAPAHTDLAPTQRILAAKGVGSIREPSRKLNASTLVPRTSDLHSHAHHHQRSVDSRHLAPDDAGEAGRLFQAPELRGVVVHNAKATELASGPGEVATIPFFKDIADQDDEIQVECAEPTVDNKITSGRMTAVACNRVCRSSATAFAGQLSGENPVGESVARMAQPNLAGVGLLGKRSTA